MPTINKLPEKNEEFIFDSNNKLPYLNRSLKLLLFLLEIPFLTGVVTKLIKRKLLLPKSTSIAKGFKCIAGNIFCMDNVNLNDTFFVDYVPIFIGNNVSFSFRNILITSVHDLKDFKKVIAKPIIIEDNVWITSNVTILPGVRIGKNSVIGAGSVVTKDIPDNVFAAGNPCKVIKKINRI